MLCNEKGEIINFVLKKANIDDRNESVIDTLTNKVFGKLYAVKGYISQSLFGKLWYDGDDSFGSIYEAMKEMLIVSDGGNFAIDITGGKKSMTAAASIFAKDFDFNIVYVDMENPDDYIPAIHQLRPGTERLNLVYSPLRDLPELFH